MRIAFDIALIAASVGGLVAVMALVKALGARLAWTAELQRKCVHVATGLYALSFPLIFADRWPVLLLVAVSLCVMLALRAGLIGGLGSTVHGVERKSFGDMLLALSVGVLFLRSAGQPILYVLPLAVLTLSDAAAALVGTRYGRRLYEVEAGTKSVEGTVMFFLVTWILGLVLLLLMTDIGRPNVVILSLVIAAFGAQIEADSWRGLDNLFVPIGIHLMLESHLGASVPSLLFMCWLFLAMVAAMLAFSQQLGLTTHAVRAMVALMFCILAVTAPHNAVLPFAAILAQAWARKRRPATGAYPDLDVIAAVAGVALFWLVAGELAGRTAINVYNLTFAAATLAFLALGLAERRGAVAIGGVGILATFALIVMANPAPAHWHGQILPWAALALATSALLAWRWPELFDRYRSPRTLLAALPIPLALFLAKAVVT